jgi:hypothetical protein
VAIKPGKKQQVATGKGVVLPRNKVFLVIGKGIALKGKVKRGSS